MLLVAFVVPARAQVSWSVMRPEDRSAVVEALDVLNLTPADTDFDKDVTKPKWALERVRGLLNAPLELPALGDEMMAAAADDDPAGVATAIRRWLEVPAPAPLTVNAAAPGLPALALPLRDGVEAFLGRAAGAAALIQRAYAGVPAEEQRHVAAAMAVGTFLVEDHAAYRPALEADGIDGDAVDAAIAAGNVIDPEPTSLRFLDACRGLALEDVIAAALELREALEELEVFVADAAIGSWPEAPLRLPTPLGDVVIGTAGSDTYTNAALLILDPGGDDRYAGEAGSANGLRERRLAAVLDLGGDDRYLGEHLLAPGVAMLGVAVLVDVGGDDVYRAAMLGTGAGVFGGAWIEDRAGDDRYQAHAMAQGAGVAGFGWLRDGAGRDVYDVGLCGQGYAEVRGVGMLVDLWGNDRYLAGGRQPDYDRNPGRYLSLAQGFAIGMRPFAGGGIAGLVDQAGNDLYVADVYGQGVGYWYAAGLLIDRDGEDTYELFQYGQGAGIHLSLGLLADGGGDDSYTGAILTQGSAHDYGVGILLDHGGRDTYTGNHHTQGRAINNAFGLLLDSGGDDAYFAAHPDRAQAIGDNGFDREYGSLALLIDLGGDDHYTCGATNGAALQRPDYGVVYDRE
jgi:hypothetical protein